MNESEDTETQDKENPTIPSDLELQFHKLSDEFFKQEPLVGISQEVLCQPPIRRISEDARPLTAAEVLVHRHLL